MRVNTPIRRVRRKLAKSRKLLPPSSSGLPHHYRSPLRHQIFALFVAFPSFLFVFLLLPRLFYQILYLLVFRPPPPRPSSPGGCWRRVLPPHLHGVPLVFSIYSANPVITLTDDWIDRDTFVSLLRSPRPSLALWWPFVRITTISPGVHHVLPQSSSLGRLYRIRALPAGYYGAADMDAGFFQDSPLHTAALALHIGDYSKHVRDSRVQAPFAVKPSMQHHLHSAGLLAPMPGSPAHSHPLHVAFERRSLHIAARFLPADWSALWLQRAKVDAFRAPLGLPPPAATFNPRFEAKDISRYYRDTVPATVAPSLPSPVWFAHDVLHHLSPSTVGSWFDANPHLTALVATAVIPPETCFDLPALRPDLYNFTRRGSQLIYIPEDDSGGAYVQPADACQWLRGGTLITPKSECLHIHLVHSLYAHHVFLISRPQLLPQTDRVLDMPKLVSIPFMDHPTGSPFSRLTEPGLLTSLVNYSVRVNATNMRDLYAKVASYRAEVYGHFGASYVRAAALHACSVRAQDFHSPMGAASRLWFLFVFFFRLPFLPVAWLYQSWTSKVFALRNDVAIVWSVKTEPLVSSSSDSRLPGLRSLCPIEDLSLWYLPPSSPALAHFTRFAAQFSVYLTMKLAFPLGVRLLSAVRPFILPLWHMFQFYVGWDSVYTPLGIFGFALAHWYGLTGPNLMYHVPYRLVWRYLRFSFAFIFALPLSRRSAPVGVSWFYTLSLSAILLFLSVPRLSIYYAYHPGWQGWFTVFFPLLSFFVLSCVFIEFRGADMVLPYHVTGAPITPPFSKLPDPTPPSVPTAVSIEAAPELPPVLLPVVASDPDTRPFPASAPLVLEPVSPDGYFPYLFSPDAYDSAASFVDVLRRPSLSPALDVDRSCVWQCLGVVFGVEPERLHSCYMAYATDADRLVLCDGLVPYDHLARIFLFFRVGVTLHSAEASEDDCPRGVGLSQPCPVYNPDSPPLSIRAAEPFWPGAVFFLVSGLNTFHLTTRANPTHAGVVLPPVFGSVVGFVSRWVPNVEIAEIVNIPKGFLRNFASITGNAVNSVRVTCPSLLGVTPFRNTFSPLPALPIVVETLDYVLTPADARLACHLASDLKAYPASMELHEWDARGLSRGLDSLAKHAKSVSPAPAVKLHLLHGAAGTGKTTAVLGWLTDRLPGFDVSNLRFHTWLNSLRGPLQESVLQHRLPGGELAFPFLQSVNFATGCMPFAQPFGGTLVLDDATQLWPGYIPLLIATNPGLTDIVVTFDAAQGRAAFPVSTALTRVDPSTAEWLSSLSSHYATLQHRLSAENSLLLGFPVPPPSPGTLRGRGKVFVVTKAPAGVPLLVVSPRFAETQNRGGQQCITFADCQGMTIHGDVAVDLGGLTVTATEHAVFTALTRATGHIFLVFGPSMTADARTSPTFAKSVILSALVSLSATFGTAELTPSLDVSHVVRDAVYSHLARCLSPASCLALGLGGPNPLVAGFSDADRFTWLEARRDTFFGDFWTARSDRACRRASRSAASPAFDRHYTLHDPPPSVAHRLRHVAAVPADAELSIASAPYVLPPAPTFDVQPDPSLMIGQFAHSERREVSLPNGNQTMQHVHDGPEAVLHHTRSDKLTVSMSEAKRIRVGYDHFTLNSAERSRLRQLQRGFAKFFDTAAWNRQRFDPASFDGAVRRSLAPWVSKRTGAAMDRSLSKNNLDRPLNEASLFLKGQYVKKEEKRFSPACAGQIVSEFSLTKQFRDAPFALYVEDMLFRYAYPSTYMHARASPAQMDSWYRRHWVANSPMTANDYTAWDGGCDRVFTAFDCWIFSLSGLPVEYVNLYRFEKTNTYSYLGPHISRQESGDRWTWILNTARNAAITGASLCCPKACPAAFSGDDGVVLGCWAGQREFHARQWLMTPKREYSSSVTFCGFLFGGQRLALSSTVILHRAQFGVALGRNDPDFWRSISDAIRESAPAASPHDVVLATAAACVNFAASRFDFSLPGSD